MLQWSLCHSLHYNTVPYAVQNEEQLDEHTTKWQSPSHQWTNKGVCHPCLLWNFSRYLIGPNRLTDRLCFNSNHSNIKLYNTLTSLRKPKDAPKKVDGTEIPNLQLKHHDILESTRNTHQRQRRASKVVNGMAAAELYDHRTKLRKKKIPNTIPG